jgi:site-specific DNA-methyltransferase (adenine-specific)
MTYSIDSFCDGKVTLFGGDNRVVLADAPDNSVDSIVTDGPYALVSIVKRFGKAGSAPAKGNEAFMRASKGFMGKTWDNGEVVNSVEFWKECLRVLKPGGHLLSFGGTRTYHRMACAVEDAGFEVRDMIQWLYGSGFPKSHDVSKNIDKQAGAVRGQIRVDAKDLNNPPNLVGGAVRGDDRPWRQEAIERGYHEKDDDTPITDDAKYWDGWGTALKPANEPIVLARKPLSEKTVAANVLKWGTGAINIDGCKVPGEKPDTTRGAPGRNLPGLNAQGRILDDGKGRFPANVITDGSDEVVAAFPYTKSGKLLTYHKLAESENGSMSGKNYARNPRQDSFGDEGSAARFFYQAKANKIDRNGSKHPTVKPVALMRYLCRLITPPGGVILDPFAGSGTTGEAALLEGFTCYLIEQEAEYLADIAKRFTAQSAANDNDELAGQIDLEDAIAAKRDVAVNMSGFNNANAA